MTMMSFRVDDSEAARAQAWAEQLGIDRSELLREALHRHLVRLAAEHEIKSWNDLPRSEAETTIASIADWGAAEDWTDWDDATR